MSNSWITTIEMSDKNEVVSSTGNRELNVLPLNKIGEDVVSVDPESYPVLYEKLLTTSEHSRYLMLCRNTAGWPGLEYEDPTITGYDVMFGDTYLKGYDGFKSLVDTYGTIDIDVTYPYSIVEDNHLCLTSSCSKFTGTCSSDLYVYLKANGENLVTVFIDYTNDDMLLYVTIGTGSAVNVPFIPYGDYSFTQLNLEIEDDKLRIFDYGTDGYLDDIAVDLSAIDEVRIVADSSTTVNAGTAASSVTTIGKESVLPNMDPPTNSIRGYSIIADKKIPVIGDIVRSNSDVHLINTLPAFSQLKTDGSEVEKEKYPLLFDSLYNSVLKLTEKTSYTLGVTPILAEQRGFSCDENFIWYSERTAEKVVKLNRQGEYLETYATTGAIHGIQAVGEFLYTVSGKSGGDLLEKYNKADFSLVWSKVIDGTQPASISSDGTYLYVYCIDTLNFRRYDMDGTNPLAINDTVTDAFALSHYNGMFMTTEGRILDTDFKLLSTFSKPDSQLHAFDYTGEVISMSADTLAFYDLEETANLPDTGLTVNGVDERIIADLEVPLFSTPILENGIDAWSNYTSAVTQDGEYIKVERNEFGFPDQCYQLLNCEIGKTYAISCSDLVITTGRPVVELDDVRISNDWDGSVIYIQPTSETPKLAINGAYTAFASFQFKEILIEEVSGSLYSKDMNFSNGYFIADESSWVNDTSIIDATDGVMTVNRNNNGFDGQLYQTVETSPGREYTISAESAVAIIGTISIVIDDVEVMTSWDGGDFTFRATTDTHTICFNGATIGTATFQLSGLKLTLK